MLVISDIHGSYGTLIRLLNECARRYPGEPIAFLGDLIDRGPDSRAVVEFAMGNAIPTCKGNHEDLALAFSAHTRRGYRAHCVRHYEPDIWLFNGGEETLANWPHFRATEDQGVPFRDGERIPTEVLDWMQALPAYLISDTLDDKGRKLLASHTGYGMEADQGDDMGWFGALWGRHPDDGPFPEDGYYRVYGHSRVQQVVVGDRWTNIDSGAAYPRYGTMTAFHWPSKALVQQPFDESPIEPRFTVVGGCLTP